MTVKITASPAKGAAPVALFDGQPIKLRALQLMWASGGSYYFSVSGFDEQDNPIELPEVKIDKLTIVGTI